MRQLRRTFARYYCCLNRIKIIALRYAKNFKHFGKGLELNAKNNMILFCDYGFLSVVCSG